MSIPLRTLAELCGASIEGDPDLIISGVAPIQDAVPGQITFLANKRYERYLDTTLASAVILDQNTPVPRGGITVLRATNPYFGFVVTLRAFHPPGSPYQKGVHPDATVHPSARLSEDVHIGPRAVIGEGVSVGARSAIAAGAVLTSGVTIGDDCIIHPNVTILAHATVGNRVIIHSGSTIGSDGFGFAPFEGRYEKIPQVGTVVIHDDVEIGANCAIDRATLGATIIGSGTKLDNLLQIAHNVEIGEHTVIAAQSGVSGSTVIGSRAMIGGQVGIVGHIEIADDVSVGAQSGVSKSILEKGKVFRGSPAHELRVELRQEAAVRKLPELIATVRALEDKLAKLELSRRAEEPASKE
jgi:UDP-3-O-[3-hydroxymyristoyl] glucosamine N-acyltransferase